MEDLWETWISSLEMDIGHSLDEDKFDIENVQQPSFSFEDFNNDNSSIHSNSSNCLISSQQTPSQYLLSFENSSVEPSPNSAIATCSSIMDPKKTTLNHNETGELPTLIKKTTKKRRSAPEIQDHIMAERKRRQVIGERFIALSATIPGLKKTDKLYILEEATNYVKQLQEKMKELDNQNTMKSKDSEIFVKKSQACIKEDDINEDKYYSKKELPKVKARVVDKEILIGIHCEKQENIVVNILDLLQNRHLSLASSSILPFGTTTLKVTIIAQMNDKYCMNVIDLVKNLRQDLSELCDYQSNISEKTT